MSASTNGCIPLWTHKSTLLAQGCVAVARKVDSTVSAITLPVLGTATENILSVFQEQVCQISRYI